MRHDDHVHAAPKTGRAFAIGVSLNVAFVIVEIVYGLSTSSVALLSDAAHNFSDVVGLALAWGASILAKRKPSSRRTYGFRRSTILAAVANAVLLLVAVGALVRETIGRIQHPEAIDGVTVLCVAAVGVFVNGASALLFMRERKRDANVRGAFVHLMADAAVSLGVLIAGSIIATTGWMWLDPATSLLVSAIVLVGARSLFKDAVNLALDAVPEHIDPETVRRYLAALPGVVDVHDLHIWAMSTTEVALTAHLIMPPGMPGSSFLHDVSAELKRMFEIEHATLQIEPPHDEPCALSPDGHV